MDILKILFFLSLISFSFGEIIRIPVFSIEIKLLDLSVALLFLAWIIVSISKKKISKIVSPFILIFSFVSFFSLLINLRFLNFSESVISFSYLARWVGYASILSVVGSFDKKFKDKIKFSLLLLGGVIVVLGYIQYFYYQNLRNLYYLGWDEHLYRMFSVFLDPNFAGAFFVLYFLFLSNLIFENYKNRKLLSIYGFISLLTLTCIFLTYSRSALIMLLIGISVFLIMKNKLKYIIVLIVIFLGLTFLVPKAYKTEGTNLLRITSSEARVGSAKEAISIFTKNPILGVGFNAYRYAKSRYGFISKSIGTSHADAGTDNSFLFVLATTGVIGFSFFIFMWYKILISHKNSALIISSVIALFADSLFINSLFYVFLIFWIWIIIGVKENK